MVKKIFDKWNSINLIFRILGGMLLAVILYLIVDIACGGTITWLPILGSLYLGALKAIAPILVFALILSSFANMKSNVGKRFTTVIILYIVTTLLAAVLAVAVCFIFKVKINLPDSGEIGNAPEGLGAVVTNLLQNIVANPVTAIANGNYMGILFWSICLGIAFKVVASETTKAFTQDVSSAIAKIVFGIISFAPFGVLGLLYSSLTEIGFGIFTDYGKLILIIVGCMLTTSLVINPIISSIMLKRNAYPLVWKCLSTSGISAFCTRSSAANIPVNMNLCKNLGLDPDFYSVSIPLGATINMDGAAVTIAVMALTAAFTKGVSVDFGTALLLCIVSTFAACGASGVPGGSTLLIPMACSLLGIDSNIAWIMVGICAQIAVIQDSVETALNSSGDVLFTATAEFLEMRKQGKEINF